MNGLRMGFISLFCMMVGFFLACSPIEEEQRPREQMGLTFTTTTPKGEQKYDPTNILAVWVEDSKGNYVETLAVYAKDQIRHLSEWNEAAGENKPDAMTGATQKKYGRYETQWDMTNYAGQTVPDGEYTIRFELTNHNKPKNQYHRTTVPFTKDGESSEKTVAMQDGYKDIEITYTGR